VIEYSVVTLSCW